MNFLEPQDWSFPVPIVYGPGRLSEIADLSTRAGMTKPLIVAVQACRFLPIYKAICPREVWILRCIQISRLIHEMMKLRQKKPSTGQVVMTG